MELIKPGTRIDFVGKRYIFGVISGCLVLASLAAFLFIGPNWGIDFTGGTEVVIQFDEPATTADVRAAIRQIGLPDDAVQQINQPEDYTFSVRVRDTTFASADMESVIIDALKGKYGQDFIVDSRFDAQVGARLVIEHKPGKVDLADVRELLKGIDGAQPESFAEDNTFQVKLPGLTSQIQKAIDESLSDKSHKIVATDSVGPKVGGDLRTQAFLSLGATLVLILLYVAFRFDIIFAPGAILALFHDVAITVGIFTLIQREVNLSMIGALLTIVGYSLNDTIVIFDRIRENMGRYRRSDTEKLINDSINETLSRTLATSITTLIAIMAFLVLGGPVINTFALAMMIGVVVGTYSTVFIASPSILVMERLKPKLVKLLVPAGTEGEETPEGDSTATSGANS